MIALAVAAMLLAPPAAADAGDQPSAETELTEKYRAYLRETGAPDASALVAQGYRGVRTLDFDAWYHPKSLITVIMKPGATPRLTADFAYAARNIRRSGSGTVSRWDWRTVELLTHELRASPVEQPQAVPTPEERAAKPGQDWIIVCADAWSSVTEVFDKRGVTMRVRDSCGDDSVWSGAESLTSMAIRALDGCGELTQIVQPAYRLAACLTFDGDEGYSDARLYQAFLAAGFHDSDEPDTAPMRARLAPTVTFTWPGQAVLSGPDALIAFWKQGAPLKGLYAGINSVRAADDAGEVTGLVTYEKSDDVSAQAEFVQHWHRDDGVWTLIDWQVGPLRDISWGDD